MRRCCIIPRATGYRIAVCLMNVWMQTWLELTDGREMHICMYKHTVTHSALEVPHTHVNQRLLALSPALSIPMFSLSHPLSVSLGCLPFPHFIFSNRFRLLSALLLAKHPYRVCSLPLCFPIFLSVICVSLLLLPISQALPEAVRQFQARDVNTWALFGSF